MGNQLVIDALLSKGVFIDIVDAQNRTPLHWSAELGNSMITAHLLSQGANLTAVNSQHQTPLQLAHFSGYGAGVYDGL